MPLPTENTDDALPPAVLLPLDSHIALKDLRAFVKKRGGTWHEAPWPQAHLGDAQSQVLLTYAFDLKELRLTPLGPNQTLAMERLEKIERQLHKAFSLAFEYKAVVEINGSYAVLTSKGCQHPDPHIVWVINDMLERYPGYLPGSLNSVAEQAAQEWNGHVVRRARADSYSPYIIY